MKKPIPDKELESKITELMSRSKLPEDSKHGIMTRKCVLKLYPKAPYHLQIAALAHDIERSSASALKSRDFNDYNVYKKLHCKRGAKIIDALLEKQKYPLPFRKKVSKLVMLHEFGGTAEADILMDADSISFFEDNLTHHLESHTAEETCKKAKWMYDRASARVKKYVRSMKFSGKEKRIMEKMLKK